MEKNLLKSLQLLKQKYQTKGFFIVGVFGSHARDENTPASDLDILYRVDKKFLDSFTGWQAISELERIKKEIAQNLKITKVDLAPQDNPSKTFQENIKNELVYV